MGAYDYCHPRFRGYLSPSKDSAGYVQSLRWVRGKYPSGGSVYLIQDNLSTRTTPAALAEARRLRIPLVPTPTHASRLNGTETRFRPILRWAFTGSNYLSWDEAKEALHHAIRLLHQVHCVTNSRPALRWWTQH